MRITAAIICLFTGQLALGQFTNSWIHYGDTYLKIGVAEEKIYEITYSDLLAAEPGLSQVDPRDLKMYLNGKQVPLWVEGETDGVLDASDFIRFYGKANDGNTDRPLYRSPGEQPHTYRSLYTDTAFYFLTWNKIGQSLRYRLSANQNTSGLPSDGYFVHKVARWFNDVWYDGAPFNDYASYSEYTEGEGWMSSDVRAGLLGITVPTPGYLNGTGVPARLEVLAYGKSNPSAPGDFDLQGNNHELSLYYNSEAGLLASTRGRGYCTHRISTEIPGSSFTPSSRILFSSTFGARQRQAISWFTISYPRSYKAIADKVLHIFPNSGKEKINLSNYTGSSQRPIVWDLEQGEIIRPLKMGQEITFRIRSGGLNDLLIADSATIIRRIPAAQIRKRVFQQIPIGSQANYLIITHRAFASGSEAYSDYRSSAEGGGYRVARVFTDDIYEQFYYGLHHPLALVHFLKYVWEQGNGQLQYLFLLGKGQNYHLFTNNPGRRLGLDFVPTMGYPASDYLFTAGLGTNYGVPGLATGRLPVKSNSEIEQYLAKVQYHERSLEESALWKKKVIQVSGGTSQAENNQLKGYLSRYASVLGADSFGGYTKMFSKDQNVIIQNNLTSQIIREIDDGSAMVTYFGHGSSDVLEIDMGFPNQYSNTGRLPLFYFNGCVLGNSYDNSSLGEKFLLEPSVGCVNWLASTYYSYTGLLFDYGMIFHRNFFRSLYGKPLGNSLIASLKEYYDPQDKLKLEMCLQFNCQGDPANRYFSPEYPDYSFDANNTKLNPSEIIANADSFNLDVAIRNLGKTYPDSVTLKLKRTNTAGFVYEQRVRFAIGSFERKLSLHLPNSDTFRGVNHLEFELDPENLIQEQGSSGEMNNRFSMEIFVPNENIFLHQPAQNAIISDMSVRLVAKSGLANATLQTVEFELDTLPDFSSAAKQQGELTAAGIFELPFSLTGKDSVDYYWRARIKGDKYSWAQSNFACIRNTAPGASQGRSDLVGRGSFEQIYIDPEGTYRFSSTTSQQYFIQTSGKFGSGSLARRGIRIDGYVARMLWFVNPGIQCLAINPRDESRFMYESQFNMTSPRDPLGFGYPTKVNDPYYILGNPTGVFEFNTTTQAGRDSLLRHLQRIPDDYYLFMYNGTETGIAQWGDSLFLEMERFGFDQLRTHLKETHPFALKGQRIAPLEAIQIFADTNNLVVPPAYQNIALTTNLSIPHSQGSISTEWIGPGKSWQQAHYSVSRSDADKIRLEIIGRDYGGNTVKLLNSDQQDLALESISADTFPFIQARFAFTDSVYRTLAQLRRWLVKYRPASDIELVQTESGFVKDTVNRGEKLVLQVILSNTGQDSFDAAALNLRYSLDDNTVLRDSTYQVPLLPPASRWIWLDTLSTEDFQGSGQVLAAFNPNRKPAEPNYLNNAAIFPFAVNPFRRNAIADIRIDGRVIMDEELVSSNPEITLLVTQIDSFLFYDKPDLYEWYFRRPESDSFELISMQQGQIRFTPTHKAGGTHTLIFNPGSLASGIYEVKARVHNPATPFEYDEVAARFKVISEQLVSNVYFYPNPFSTQAQIVYTLTGEGPPDVFRIEIFTISGRRVKTIDLHEFEEMKIGTHLSGYRWDGTDDFGDRLANGVYLYKSTVRIAGQDLKRLEQKNDELFTGGFGKIFLMR